MAEKLSPKGNKLTPKMLKALTILHEAANGTIDPNSNLAKESVGEWVTDGWYGFGINRASLMALVRRSMAELKTPAQLKEIGVTVKSWTAHYRITALGRDVIAALAPEAPDAAKEAEAADMVKCVGFGQFEAVDQDEGAAYLGEKTLAKLRNGGMQLLTDEDIDTAPVDAVSEPEAAEDEHDSLDYTPSIFYTDDGVPTEMDKLAFRLEQALDRIAALESEVKRLSKRISSTNDYLDG